MSGPNQARKSCSLQLQGTVVTGVGEGKFFLSGPHYSGQIEELFGFSPYPGTLNLKLSPEEHRRVLEFTRPNLKILVGRDTTSEEEKLFSVGAHPCELLGVGSLLLFPEKTRHRDVLEIAAPVGFREEFGLVDGETLELSIPGGGQ